MRNVNSSVSFFFVDDFDGNAGRDVGVLHQFVHFQPGGFKNILCFVYFRIETVVDGDFLVLVHAVDVALSASEVDFAETTEFVDAVVIVADLQMAQVFQIAYRFFSLFFLLFRESFVLDDNVVFFIACLVSNGGGVLRSEVIQFIDHMVRSDVPDAHEVLVEDNAGFRFAAGVTDGRIIDVVQFFQLVFEQLCQVCHFLEILSFDEDFFAFGCPCPFFSIKASPPPARALPPPPWKFSLLSMASRLMSLMRNPLDWSITMAFRSFSVRLPIFSKSSFSLMVMLASAEYTLEAYCSISGISFRRSSYERTASSVLISVLPLGKVR